MFSAGFLHPDLTTDVDAALAKLGPRSRVTDGHILAQLAQRAYQRGQDAAIRDLLTTDQVAAALGVSHQRVWQLARDYAVGWRIGRDVLFRPADVEVMRARRRIPGRPKRTPAHP